MINESRALRAPCTVAAAALMAVAVLCSACTSVREVAGAINGQPYVPTAEERAAMPARPDFKLLEPPSGKVALYFYRTSQLLGGGMDYQVWLDDKMVGLVPSGEYLRVLVEPGRYQLKAHPNFQLFFKAELLGEIDVTPDTVRTVRIRVGAKQLSSWTKTSASGKMTVGGFWTADSQLFEVDQTEAAFDMARIKPAAGSAP
ncbi:hypothetical protein RQP53_18925 [Paucibacter sp. APW11]|uniref:DUF2846 domain-containing protein n=1 Tax=Roseateles aquae TaxID=3077235 RepID=A0ABU3PFP8_9BURK|nr:hypothetical protein [Paucibacter sp. APW11]MDT9001361.1 hypothetical protein [Paucibacter sp. APW11]